MIKKIKDLLYNKNDVVIVLAILVIAGFVIWNRIDVIMDYPSNLIANAGQENGLSDDPSVETPEDPSTDPEDEVIDPDQEGEPVDDVLMYAVYINPGETLQSIGQKFVDVGLFPKVETFIQLANDMGVSTKIQAGNFILPSNSTPEEVMKIIVTPGL